MVVANAFRAENTEPFELSDFLLVWDPEEQTTSKDPSPEQLLGIVRGIHGGLGGRQQDPEAEGGPPRPPSQPSQSE